MKKFWKKYNLPIIIMICLLGWAMIIYISWLFSLKIPLNKGFLGPIPWANFDGAHYLIISRYSYGTYQQAFFPLFPILISLVKPFFLNRFDGALFITRVSFLISIIIFIKLALLDMRRDKVIWALILFILFPTSFFFISVYSGSIFLALSLGSFYAMREKHFVIAAILAGIASATRIFGMFIVFSLILEFFLAIKKEERLSTKNILKSLGLGVLSLSGLFSYMFYLWRNYKDPLLFVHVQPAFGAHRSVNHIILLPQVLFRYIKIFLTVPYASHDFLISLFEFITFCFIFTTLLIFWKKVRFSYLLYSFLIILFPTLSGTLSSTPRYSALVFPLFFIIGGIKRTWLKIVIVSIFGILLIILTAFFLRGYFIA